MYLERPDAATAWGKVALRLFWAMANIEISTHEKYSTRQLQNPRGVHRPTNEKQASVNFELEFRRVRELAVFGVSSICFRFSIHISMN